MNSLDGGGGPHKLRLTNLAARLFAGDAAWPFTRFKTGATSPRKLSSRMLDMKASVALAAIALAQRLVGEPAASSPGWPLNLTAKVN